MTSASSQLSIDDVFAALAVAQLPIEPSVTQRDAMRTKLHARLRGAAQVATHPAAAISPILAALTPFTTVHQIAASSHAWENLCGGGVARLVLIDTPNTFAWLFRLAPGATIPAHVHEADEECIVLDGEARLGDLHLKAGDFHFAPAGSAHGIIRSAQGCTLYLRTNPS